MTRNGAFDVTITFTENVTGFAASDLTFSGASASASLKSGNSGTAAYVVTVTPTSSGNLTITVPADAAEDAAGNGNTVKSSSAITVDMSRPTVTITVPSTLQNTFFNVNIEFSESVTGFVIGDIGLSGAAATKSNFSGSGTNYSVRITPTAEGTVTITVPVNAAVDTAGNGNTVASATVNVDPIPPTVTISGEPTIEKNVPFDLTVTFSEAVNGFAVPTDLMLTGPATASLKSGVGNKDYVVTITPAANS